MMNALDVDESLTLLPVVHGSASYAVAVRRFLLENKFDCIAIPLPDSFRAAVLTGVQKLPTPSAVVQLTPSGDVTESDSDESEFGETNDIEKEAWETNDGDNDDGEANISGGNTDSDKRFATYVPIDPCQAVVTAIRFGLMDRIAIEFVDQESDTFDQEALLVPDPFVLRTTSIERFCTATLPAIPPPVGQQRKSRIQFMASRLTQLQSRYSKIICLCDLQDWPWLRDAKRDLDRERNAAPSLANLFPPHTNDPQSSFPAENYGVDSRTLLFFLGELPFITSLYEQARSSLDEDDSLVVDGIKELLISARQSYAADLGHRARKITPMLLSQCLKFIRNQTLLDRRFSPSFYTIAKSTQQILGDQYTIHLVEAAKNYSYEEPLPWPTLKMGIDRATLPEHGLVEMINRLPGAPSTWHSLELNRPALKSDKRKWQTRWNPYQQCSWPEEDTRIESFRNRVLDRAMGLIGADLARTEKFTTSMMDGIDLRETLRHWYDGSLYVKVVPPSVGTLDATVMLFDNEPDPQEYSWRATWFAEHEEESTLAFYATPFQKEMLGPGVAVSTYGGAMFLFPPRPIEDIWEDERLDFADTLEQRLVSAACLHCQSRHIALLSWTPPGLALKKIAKMFKKSLVHVPLGHFADSVVQQLRTFHVLNGKHVRSYAAHFIRKA